MFDKLDLNFVRLAAKNCFSMRFVWEFYALYLIKFMILILYGLINNFV